MGEPMSYIFVVITTPDKEEAVKIVRSLLKERLIACSNILGPVSSLFWWQGKIEEENEFLVFMKSRKSLFERISKRVTELHSYDLPEIILYAREIHIFLNCISSIPVHSFTVAQVVDEFRYDTTIEIIVHMIVIWWTVEM